MCINKFAAKRRRDFGERGPSRFDEYVRNNVSINHRDATPFEDLGGGGLAHSDPAGQPK